MSENNLKMSSSPHIRSKATTSNIMLLVAIALLPASAFGVWNFGLPAFGMLVTTTVVAVLTEYIYEKLMHKKITINDWSAAVTGLLLGLNMPPTAPWWMGAIGSVFAILIVKQLFGGLGQNFMNLMGVIDLRIPGTYIVTFVIFVGIFGHIANPDVGFFDPQYITAHLCGGGLMLGAWFMATDYVTSPITPKGQFVYGIILGVLTGLFRLFGGSAEGVSYAIIISNLLVPLIERVTLPKPFGKGGEK